jgi:hypothetical protein
MSKSVFGIFIGNNTAPWFQILRISNKIRLGENTWVSRVTIENTNCSIPVWIVLSTNCRTPLIVYVVLRLNTHADGVTKHTHCDEDQAIGLGNMACNQILDCFLQFLKIRKGKEGLDTGTE